MADDFGEKTQDPTPHRLQQAREHGQFARSQDLSSALVLVGAVLLISWMGSGIADFLNDLTKQQLGEPWIATGPDHIFGWWQMVGYELAKRVLPLLALILLISVAAQWMQTGLVFIPDKAMPDVSHLNPIKGFSRIFSLPNFVRLGFGIIKVAMIATVALVSLIGERAKILGLAALSLGELATVMIDLILGISLKIGGALLVLALLDYLFQRWKHFQDLRMTTQEVREEMRNLEGDPQVIARRKAVQRKLAMTRLSSAVPKADVVVTNPTELAVAIQYDVESMKAPVVVAKGAGVVAQRIRQLALEHGVPVIEKKPLAQALFRDVEIGRPIPMEMYAAVAELLAYVYQLRGKAPPARPAA